MHNKAFPFSPLEREIKEKQDIKQALKELEDFKCYITKVVEDYINMIDMKIATQERKLEETAENIEVVATDILNKALADGKVIINATYNPETESMIIGGNIDG